MNVFVVRLFISTNFRINIFIFSFSPITELVKNKYLWSCKNVFVETNKRILIENLLDKFRTPKDLLSPINNCYAVRHVSYCVFERVRLQRSNSSFIEPSKQLLFKFKYVLDWYWLRTLSETITPKISFKQLIISINKHIAA